MKRYWKKTLSMFLAAAIAAASYVLPVSAKEAVPKPVIFTETITDSTVSLQVYGAKNSTLYIKCGKKTVAKKKYIEESVKTIKIKPQKAGSTLKFYSCQSGGRSASVKKKVKKLSSQKVSKNIKKPVISSGAVKSTDSKIRIKGYKDTELYIKNDSNKVINTVKYTKTGKKTVYIPEQDDTGTLYFYLVKGNRRSAAVRKTVKDVTPPVKPFVSEQDDSTLWIKGDLGSAVYIKYGTKDSFSREGIITGRKGIVISGLEPNRRGYYYVKLKDAGGNFGPVKKVKSDFFEEPDDWDDDWNDDPEEPAKPEEPKQPEQPEKPEEPVVEYSYTITPLLPPFNTYFYVQTDNPDPSEIRFIDRDSIYYESWSVPSALKPVERRFIDVAYENKETGRVKGGYIFVNTGAGLDGGSLILQKKDGTSYTDTKTVVSCPQVKGYREYLMDTYMKPENSFFENMDAIQNGLNSIALYPRGAKDISKVNEDTPYPLLAVSPYPELGLNEHFQMYEKTEDPMFVSYLYPYVLDSLAFPSVLSAIAEHLDPDCKVEWSSMHYMIKITKDGETRYYGGSGNGGSEPVYSNHIEQLFLFDGSEKDYVGKSTLENIWEKNYEYGEYAREDAAAYRDLLRGKAFSEAIGLGSWIRVGTEGGYVSSYAYVTQGSVYTEGKIPYSVENVWVDGRYIDICNKFVEGAEFSEHPQADIIIRNMTYTDKYQNTCLGDARYRYDETSGCWLFRAGGYESAAVDELPDEFVLTQEEVSESGIDRNKDVIPSGLVYDGTEYPGTPY